MNSAPTFSLNLDEINKLKKTIINSSVVADDVNDYECNLSKTVLLADNLDSKTVVELSLKKRNFHTIQNSLQPLAEKIELVNRLEPVPLQFFSEQFNILSAGAKNLFSDFRFNQFTDRYQFIESIFSKLQLNITYNRYQIFYQIINELVMNVQVNAVKQAKNSNQNDSVLKIELANGYVAVSMIDYYGSLDVEKLLKRLHNVQATGISSAIQFNESTGSGIGVSMIYNYCDSLLLGSVPDEVTRISVVFPFNINENKTEFLQKSIHRIG